MKKHKFLRALISVIFSLFLFVAAVLPCFAVEFDVGGGSGFSHRADPLFFPSVRFNVHPVTYNNVFNSDYYFSFPFDPMFTNYVTSDVFCDNSGLLSNSLVDTDDSSLTSCSLEYNFYSYSGTYHYLNGGIVECYFSHSINCYEDCNAVSFSVDQFFAWSTPIDGHNSEFLIDIDLSSSDFDLSLYEDWMYISFEYIPVGSYYPNSSYTYVNLPISDFLNPTGDHLIISLDSYFNDLDSGSVFYDVRDFQFYIPVDFSATIVYSGSVTYFVNPDISDVSKLYPTISEQMELRDYTSWITSAVEGFLFLEIFPGFYLSGFLMAILGFVIFIWALKVFAGG